MHRFFVDGDLSGQVNIKSDDINHIVKVLRMQRGDELIVVSQNGNVAVAVIDIITKQEVVVQIKETLLNFEKPKLRVILGQGVSKGEKMDLVVQKAVELGVSDIVPLQLERSVVRYDDQKARIKTQRWQKISLEASKQCQSNFITKVHAPLSLKEALNNFSVDTGFVAYEDEKLDSLRCYLHDVNKKIQSIFVIIGPEGGFTLFEIEQIKASGMKVVSLGNRILRTETAAIATLSLVMYELDDFGGKKDA